nr:hypothetical protein [Mycoplasmopsis bovis]
MPAREILVLIKALELKQLQSFRTEKKKTCHKEKTTLIREKNWENYPKLKKAITRAKSKRESFYLFKDLEIAKKG